MSRMIACNETHPDFDRPWCQAILSSPQYEDLSTSSRRARPFEQMEGALTLFAETWRTNTTIRAMRSLRRRTTPPSSESPEYTFLLSLGTGLGSWTNTLHGGAAAAILDQCLTFPSFADGQPVFTKQLTVQYRKPVPLPGAIMCRSVILRRHGRTLYMQGSLEDGLGEIYCAAESEGVLVAVNRGALL